MNQSLAITLTQDQQQKRRMRFLMIGGIFFSCVAPMLAAAWLGRDKNAFVLFVNTFMLGGIIGGLGLITSFDSDTDWRKEGRWFARGMLFGGIPLLLLFHLFILSAIVPEARNAKPGMTYRMGKYLVVESDGNLEVLASGGRYNFTDRVITTMPAAVSFWDLHGIADGKDVQVVVQTERSFNRRIPTLVLPTDEKALLTLYKRSLGQPLKEVISEQVAGLVVRYIESLPTEERLGVKKLTLVWDVPVNSMFHSIGAQLEDSNQLTLLVQVSPKPKVQAPILIQNQNLGATERMVSVSSLGM